MIQSITAFICIFPLKFIAFLMNVFIEVETVEEDRQNLRINAKKITN